MFASVFCLLLLGQLAWSDPLWTPVSSKIFPQCSTSHILNMTFSLQGQFTPMERCQTIASEKLSELNSTATIASILWRTDGQGCIIWICPENSTTLTPVKNTIYGSNSTVVFLLSSGISFVPQTIWDCDDAIFCHGRGRSVRLASGLLGCFCSCAPGFKGRRCDEVLSHYNAPRGVLVDALNSSFVGLDHALTQRIQQSGQTVLEGNITHFLAFIRGSTNTLELLQQNGLRTSAIFHNEQRGDSRFFFETLISFSSSQDSGWASLQIPNTSNENVISNPPMVVISGVENTSHESNITASLTLSDTGSTRSWNVSCFMATPNSAVLNEYGEVGLGLPSVLCNTSTPWVCLFPLQPNGLNFSVDINARGFRRSINCSQPTAALWVSTFHPPEQRNATQVPQTRIADFSPVILAAVLLVVCLAFTIVFAKGGWYFRTGLMLCSASWLFAMVILGLTHQTVPPPKILAVFHMSTIVTGHKVPLKAVSVIADGMCHPLMDLFGNYSSSLPMYWSVTCVGMEPASLKNGLTFDDCMSKNASTANLSSWSCTDGENFQSFNLWNSRTTVAKPAQVATSYHDIFISIPKSEISLERGTALKPISVQIGDKHLSLDAVLLPGTASNVSVCAFTKKNITNVTSLVVVDPVKTSDKSVPRGVSSDIEPVGIAPISAEPIMYFDVENSAFDFAKNSLNGHTMTFWSKLHPSSSGFLMIVCDRTVRKTLNDDPFTVWIAKALTPLATDESVAQFDPPAIAANMNVYFSIFVSNKTLRIVAAKAGHPTHLHLSWNADEIFDSSWHFVALSFWERATPTEKGFVELTLDSRPNSDKTASRRCFNNEFEGVKHVTDDLRFLTEKPVGGAALLLLPNNVNASLFGVQVHSFLEPRLVSVLGTQSQFETYAESQESIALGIFLLLVFFVCSVIAAVLLRVAIVKQNEEAVANELEEDNLAHRGISNARQKTVMRKVRLRNPTQLLQRLAIIIPLINNVAQTTLILYLPYFHFPFQFSIPFAYIFFIFSFSFNIPFPEIPAIVINTVQACLEIFSSVVVYFLSQNDEMKFQRVLDGLIEERHDEASAGGGHLPRPIKNPDGLQALMRYRIGHRDVAGIVSRSVIQDAFDKLIENLDEDLELDFPDENSQPNFNSSQQMVSENIMNKGRLLKKVKIEEGFGFASSPISIWLLCPSSAKSVLENGLPSQFLWAVQEAPKLFGKELRQCTPRQAVSAACALLGYFGELPTIVETFYSMHGICDDEKELTELLAQIPEQDPLSNPRARTLYAAIMKRVFDFLNNYYYIASTLFHSLQTSITRGQIHLRRIAKLQWLKILAKSQVHPASMNSWLKHHLRATSSLTRELNKVLASPVREWVKITDMWLQNGLLADETVQWLEMHGVDVKIRSESLFNTDASFFTHVAPIENRVCDEPEFVAAAAEGAPEEPNEMEADTGLETFGCALRSAHSLELNVQSIFADHGGYHDEESDDDVDKETDMNLFDLGQLLKNSVSSQLVRKFVACVATLMFPFFTQSHGTILSATNHRDLDFLHAFLDPRNPHAIEIFKCFTFLLRWKGFSTCFKDELSDPFGYGYIQDGVEEMEDGEAITPMMREVLPRRLRGKFVPHGLVRNEEAVAVYEACLDHCLQCFVSQQHRDIVSRQATMSDIYHSQLQTGRLVLRPMVPVEVLLNQCGDDHPDILKDPFQVYFISNDSQESADPVEMSASILCPVHLECMFPAVPTVHGLVREQQPEAYPCVQKDNAVFNRLLCNLFQNRQPCNPSEFYVCPNFTCNFSICKTCFELRLSTWDWLRAIGARFQFMLSQYGTGGVIGLLFVLLTDSMFLPTLHYALSMISCHYSTMCQFEDQNNYCYSVPTHLLVASFSGTVFVLSGIALPMFMFRETMRRKTAILNQGVIQEQFLSFPGKTALRPRPTTFFQILFCASTDPSWEMFLSADTTMMRPIYELFEFRYMPLHALMLMAKLFQVCAVLFVGDNNSLARIGAMASVEIAQLILFLVTTPFSNPWITLLSQAGMLHQIGQLGLLCFFRFEAVSHPRDDSSIAAIGMMILASAYLITVIVVVVFVVVLPLLEMRRFNQAQEARLRSEKDARSKHDREERRRAQLERSMGPSAVEVEIDEDDEFTQLEADTFAPLTTTTNSTGKLSGVQSNTSTTSSPHDRLKKAQGMFTFLQRAVNDAGVKSPGIRK